MIRRRFAQKSTDVMEPTLIKQDGEVIEAPYRRGPEDMYVPFALLSNSTKLNLIRSRVSS